MQLPGHVVGDSRGPVPHGEAFAATTLDGAPVEVEVLRVADPFARVRLLSAADALRRGDGRGLARVRQVLGPPAHGLGEDVVVVVRDAVAGPDLETGHVALAAGEALAVVADVLDALAVLHDEGLAHGDLDGRAVRLDESVPARRTVRLTGWGTAALLSGRPARPADDVRDAGLLLDGLLGGEVPSAVQDALAALLSADPSSRPDATAAAASLRAVRLDAARREPPVTRPAARAVPPAVPALAPVPAPVPAAVPAVDEPGATAGPSLPPDRRWRRLVTAAGAGAVLLPAAALAAVLVAADDPADDGRRVPGPYVFAPLARPDGLVVERRWALEDGGAVLRSTTTVRNTTGGPLSGDVDEVVPASIADEVADLALEPEPDEVVEQDEVADTDPVVRYRVTDLEAYGRTSWEYVVTLRRSVSSLVGLAGEADRARLAHEVRLRTSPAPSASATGSASAAPG